MKLQALLVPVIALAMLPGSAVIAAPSHYSTRVVTSYHRASGVYVCKMCKTYYSRADARKMGYKDGMGHKLTYRRTHPRGYTMGGGISGTMSHSGHSMSGMSQM